MKTFNNPTAEKYRRFANRLSLKSIAETPGFPLFTRIFDIALDYVGCFIDSGYMSAPDGMKLNRIVIHTPVKVIYPIENVLKLSGFQFNNLQMNNSQFNIYSIIGIVRQQMLDLKFFDAADKQVSIDYYDMLGELIKQGTPEKIWSMIEKFAYQKSAAIGSIAFIGDLGLMGLVVDYDAESNLSPTKKYYVLVPGRPLPLDNADVVDMNMTELKRKNFIVDKNGESYYADETGKPSIKEFLRHIEELQRPFTETSTWESSLYQGKNKLLITTQELEKKNDTNKSTTSSPFKLKRTKLILTSDKNNTLTENLEGLLQSVNQINKGKDSYYSAQERIVSLQARYELLFKSKKAQKFYEEEKDITFSETQLIEYLEIAHKELEGKKLIKSNKEDLIRYARNNGAFFKQSVYKSRKNLIENFLYGFEHLNDNTVVSFQDLYEKLKSKKYSLDIKYENTNILVIDHMVLKMRAFIFYIKNELEKWVPIKENTNTYWKSDILLNEQNVKFSNTSNKPNLIDKDKESTNNDDVVLKFIPWGFWVFPFDEKEISGFLDIGNFKKI